MKEKNYDIDELMNQSFGMDLELDDPEMIDTAPIIIDLEEVNEEARTLATLITERLSGYFFDQKYIDNHPYIPTKIANEMNNIRRLLKMLSINEKAQDILINGIALQPTKSTLFMSLNQMQKATLDVQRQLNERTTALEDIFSKMQAECEKTFQDKEKEQGDDGNMITRGSKEFIKQIMAGMYRTVTTAAPTVTEQSNELEETPLEDIIG